MTTYSFPGAIGDMPPTPNKVESTWGNAIRGRVVNQFANDSDRDAAIGSPVEGMACYVAGDHTLEVYTGATDGWCAPWNMPWGEVEATKLSSSSQSGFTGDITGLAVTFEAVANRVYIVECDCELLPSASTVGVIVLQVQEGGTALKRTQIPSGSYATPLGIDLSCPAGSLAFRRAATPSRLRAPSLERARSRLTCHRSTPRLSASWTMARPAHRRKQVIAAARRTAQWTGGRIQGSAADAILAWPRRSSDVNSRRLLEPGSRPRWWCAHGPRPRGSVSYDRPGIRELRAERLAVGRRGWLLVRGGPQ